jgi:hypothetical protein
MQRLNLKPSKGNRQMYKPLIQYGFIMAGIMNIGGVLLFSRLFTNRAINQADPVVMSNFGLLMITVWGLAYLSVARSYVSVRWLVGVFALEKLVYTCAWFTWLAHNSLTPLYDKDLFAGIFYSIYGVNDLTFMIFFGWVFYQTNNNIDKQNS